MSMQDLNENVFALHDKFDEVIDELVKLNKSFLEFRKECDERNKGVSEKMPELMGDIAFAFKSTGDEIVRVLEMASNIMARHNHK